MYNKWILLFILNSFSLFAGHIHIESPSVYLLEDAKSINFLLSEKPLFFEDLNISDFENLQPAKIDFGSSEKELWINFSITSSLKEEPFVLELIDSEIDQFDVYISYPDGAVEMFQMGQLQWDSSRFFSGFSPAVPLILKNSGEIQITIRCNSFYKLRTPLRILPMQQFKTYNGVKTLLYGLVLGTFIVLFIQMLIIFVEIKDIRYIYLALYILSVSMFVFIGYGMMRNMVLQVDSILSRYLIQRGAVQWTGILYISLLLYHLNLYKKLNLSQKIRKGFLLLALAIIPLNIFLYRADNYSQIVIPFSIYLGLTLSFIIWFDARNIKILDTPSIVFFWSFLPPSFFIVYRILETVHLLPYFGYSSLLLPILLVIQVLIFSNRSRLELLQYKDATETAENESRQQREEIEQMMHQLKNPLNNILHMLNAHKESAGIKGECHRILRYMDARALLFDPDGKHQVFLSPLPLAPLLQDITTRYKVMAAQEKISLTLIEDKWECSILSHQELLSQLLEELMVNAIKYTPAKGNIVLESREENGKILISIKDSGPGIPEEESRNIYKKGIRLPSSNVTGAAGQGLGLYRVSRLAEKMKIQIEQRNRVPHGTEFVLNVPKAELESPLVSGNPVESCGIIIQGDSKTTEFTLMILEDEDYMRKSLLEVFQKHCKVIACTDGKQALTFLEEMEKKPDIILCDNYMPIMGGMEFLVQLKRKSREIASIPLIIHSAVNNHANRLEAFKKGAVGYIAKPCPKEELKRCVLSNLQKVRKQQHTIRQSTLEEIAGMARDEFSVDKENPDFIRFFEEMGIKGRTREVFLLLCKGTNRRDLLKILQIKENSLKDYLRNLYDLFEIRNFAELQSFLQDMYGHTAEVHL